MIKPYEAMFIFRPDLAEDALKKLIAQVEEAIVKAGGTVELSQPWGHRRLAYPIARQKEGVYHLTIFTCPSLAIDQLKQAYRLNEQIVRTLILVLESLPTTAPVITSPTAEPSPIAA